MPTTPRWTRSAARLLFTLTAVAVFIWVQPAVAEKPRKLAGSRPNIILVMTDDQGKGDLSCLGNRVLKTPNLDRLYGLSTRFTDFHVSPTCAPTRSAIMSGRHEFRNGVTHTIKERERMALSTTTIAQVLQKAGYATAIVGKWHLGDEEPYQPHNRGFQEVFIHGAGGIGQSYPGSCADVPPNRTNRYFDCVIRHNKTFVKTTGFCTDVFFRHALGWIKRQKDKKEPFFAYISTNAPHGPMIAPQKYKAPFLKAGFDGKTAGRYGMIANIDDNMGVLLNKMKEWKLEENTLLIFMTDNGQAGRRARRNGKRYTLHTAGLRAGKGSPYEGGTRVPPSGAGRAFCRKGRTLPDCLLTSICSRHSHKSPARSFRRHCRDSTAAVCSRCSRIRKRSGLTDYCSSTRAAGRRGPIRTNPSSATVPSARRGSAWSTTPSCTTFRTTPAKRPTSSTSTRKPSRRCEPPTTNGGPQRFP